MRRYPTAKAVRDRSELPGRLRELVVLATSMPLNARVEYEFHPPFARNEGLSDAVITAIGERKEPSFPGRMNACEFSFKVTKSAHALRSCIHLPRSFLSTK